MPSAPSPRDLFAEIAASRTQLRQGLVIPSPPPLPDRILPLSKRYQPFRPPPSVSTPEALERLLATERKRMAPFLQELFPPLPSLRLVVDLPSFDWRIEEREDRNHFQRVLDGKGSWQRVSIPHYGAPLGPAVTYYRTTFFLTPAMIDRGAIVVHCDGVDYIAHLFLNGMYLGSHEGFFAPFEFDATSAARLGENVLVIKVENDGVHKGSGSKPDDPVGDKIYAATGPGYDEPIYGWHHCPPGMGVYQPVRVEARSRIHLHDLFVRPLPEKDAIEAWIEVTSLDRNSWREATVEVAVFGQNFRKTAIPWHRPPMPGPLGPGINELRFTLPLPRHRRWEPDAPWLYRLQVRLLDSEGKVIDTGSRQFGMRSFVIDESSSPKGRLLFNGRPIRLRGANTMGYEQQAVMAKDRQRLIDDMLLARVCHMNFLRLTQRPVQEEIYDVCDRLGILIQTDLPLFGKLRRTKVIEAIRQAQEMERLVRSHPCCILDSFINEPFPASWGAKTYREVDRNELEAFFEAATIAIRLQNPDRAIKPIDGDYDPPGPGLPDNHAYPAWYNGHAIDLGKLHQGWWVAVKPDWFYACGEFGAEGLEDPDLMRRRYPAEWLPQTPEGEREWTPARIPYAQTWNMHFMFFDRQHSLADWSRVSQAYQAWATRIMTEAFRRDNRMVSFAIHLFIDAWPSGWMKAIMDCERRPKRAFFAYRDALAPLYPHFRSDRFSFFGGEVAELEAWICCDPLDPPKGTRLAYQLEEGGKVVMGGTVPVEIPSGSARCIGRVRFPLPTVEKRTSVLARIAVCKEDRVLGSSSLALEVFPVEPSTSLSAVTVVGERGGAASRLAKQLALRSRKGATTILVDGNVWEKERANLEKAAQRGARIVILGLPVGKHKVAGEEIGISPSSLEQYHFASRATGHRRVEGFQPDDFRFWYDEAAGRVTPFLGSGIEPTAGWEPILTTGVGQFWGGPGLHLAYACAEHPYGKGSICICQISLVDRVRTNPVAQIFARRLLEP